MEETVENEKPKMVTLGPSNAGKSKLICELLGTLVFPTAAHPQTSYPMFGATHQLKYFEISGVNNQRVCSVQRFETRKEFFKFCKEKTRKDKWPGGRVDKFEIKYPEECIKDHPEMKKWELVDMPGLGEVTSTVNYREVFRDHFHEITCFYVVNMVEGTHRKFQSSSEVDHKEVRRFLNKQTHRELNVVLTNFTAYFTNKKREILDEFDGDEEECPSRQEILRRVILDVKDEFLVPLKENFKKISVFLYDIVEDPNIWYKSSSLGLDITGEPPSGERLGYYLINDLTPIRKRIQGQYLVMKRNQRLHLTHQLFSKMLESEFPLFTSSIQTELFDEINQETQELRSNALLKLRLWFLDTLPNWVQKELDLINSQDKKKEWRFSHENFISHLQGSLEPRLVNEVSEVMAELIADFLQKSSRKVSETMERRKAILGLKDNTDIFNKEVALMKGLLGTYGTAMGLSVATMGGTTAVVAAEVVLAGAFIGLTIGLAAGWGLWKIGWSRTKVIQRVAAEIVTEVQDKKSHILEQLDKNLDQGLRKLIEKMAEKGCLVNRNVVEEELVQNLGVDEETAKEYFMSRQTARQGYLEYDELFLDLTQ